ncbi:MAG: LacI family DNA-binding transcriptional regulator [Bacillota bacterium]
MALTIKDVAEKAGVSYATVSRALNNHPEVNEKTRKRILEIAQDMGYQPNAIAQGLVKSETRTIGLLIPDITNPFFPEVARGVEEAAEKAGYSIFLCNTNWNSERESKYINVLLQKQVDGVIIAPSSESPAHLQKLMESNTKTVFVSRIIRQLNTTSIIIDNVSGAVMAMEHLLQEGHKRIGFISGPLDISANKDRLRGYREALESNGIEIDDVLIKEGDFKRESGHFLMHDLLALEEKPTAIFAANDLLALGAIRAIREEGYQIPEEVAVVGFDDIEFASLPEIQLSTVSQPKYDLGKLAFEVLCDQIKGGDSYKAGRKILLDPELKIRRTSSNKKKGELPE